MSLDLAIAFGFTLALGLLAGYMIGSDASRRGSEHKILSVWAELPAQDMPIGDVIDGLHRELAKGIWKYAVITARENTDGSIAFRAEISVTKRL